MSKKYALIIANTEYSDPDLAQLKAPGKDANDFAEILKAPDFGGFDEVRTVINEESSTAREAIEEFFNDKGREDLLVLYFSGHGVKDDTGKLYLAVKNTKRKKLRSTGIESEFIREMADQSRSKKQVLILDCCNSGAFAKGTKGDNSVGASTAFGSGQIILTATDSTQFAWEGDRVIGEETENSLFTHYLIEGLRSGGADNDGDGQITVDELYEYASEKVRSVTSKQNPLKFSNKQQGNIILREGVPYKNIPSAQVFTAQLETPDDDPDARLLRAAQKKNDWRTVQDFFSNLTDINDREFYVDKLTEWEMRPNFFDMWIKANPACSDAWLLRGAHGVKWAWEARTHATADDVAQEAFEIFSERLTEAKKDLEQAVKLNPKDPTPYGHLVTCARGLSLGEEVATDYLRSSTSLGVLSWQAHSSALQNFCLKWGGSHQTMFDFVRKVSASAPDGHGIHALIPIAHFERWVYANSDDDEQELAGKYYRQPEVQREILIAYTRSLGSNAFKPNKLTRVQSGIFAFGLLKIQAYELALAEFERLGDRIPGPPWTQFGDPISIYTDYVNAIKSMLGAK